MGSRSAFTRHSSLLPPVCRIVISDGGFHVLQLIQNSKHIYKLSKSKKISLRHKVSLTSFMTQPLYFTVKQLNGFLLRTKRGKMSSSGSFQRERCDRRDPTWNLIKSMSLATSGASTSTVVVCISDLLSCVSDITCGTALEQLLQVYNILACFSPSASISFYGR